MKLVDAIEKLKSLNHSLGQRLKTQQYLCHYPFESELESCLETVIMPEADSEMHKKLLQDFQTVKTELEAALLTLNKANERMIKRLNFEATCKALIKANDLANFNELFNIGHYFGTGPMGREVSETLAEVYDFYRTHPNLRSAFIKPCLDRLADILRSPRLDIPQSSAQLFPNSRESIKAILKANKSTDLMIWLLHANQEDRDFALRSAASVDICKDCLAFLLRRTAPGRERSINLLAGGQPSGQTALHRAILSGKSLIVRMLFDSEINPSNDILRQLLARDKDGLSPVDLIERIKKEDDLENLLTISSMLDSMKKALYEYQSNPQLGLPASDFLTVKQNISRIGTVIDQQIQALYDGNRPTIMASAVLNS